MNHSVWTKGIPVTLMEVLDAREKRAQFQQEMLKKNPVSLVCFTMNIAGPVKTFPLIKFLYEIGISIIKKGIFQLEGNILELKETKENTGYESFFSLSLSPEMIKTYLIEQEEQHPLGRLFDFDVLRPDGTKVSRCELGFTERKCLLCDRAAYLCGRSRTHTADELITREIKMIEAFYVDHMSVYIGKLMQQALICEVDTTPKPGLVDKEHSGSHTDMCRQTFLDSAHALTPYFIKCAHAGLTFDNSPDALPTLFPALRKLGKEAEVIMQKATNGVNTHKGAIFSGGILCAAAGYMKSRFNTDFGVPDALDLLSEICRKMLPDLLNDYKYLDTESAKSHGEKLYLKHGITGIRGEAAKGFPHIFNHGITLFQQLLSSKTDFNQAGLLTLLYYIANTEDTNLITRSDFDTARKIQAELSCFLKNSTYKEQLAVIPELDRYFVSKNISPGGSADMLALTYFLYFLQTLDCLWDK